MNNLELKMEISLFRNHSSKSLTPVGTIVTLRDFISHLNLSEGSTKGNDTPCVGNVRYLPNTAKLPENTTFLESEDSVSYICIDADSPEACELVERFLSENELYENVLTQESISSKPSYRKCHYYILVSGISYKLFTETLAEMKDLAKLLKSDSTIYNLNRIIYGSTHKVDCLPSVKPINLFDFNIMVKYYKKVLTKGHEFTLDQLKNEVIQESIVVNEEERLDEYQVKSREIAPIEVSELTDVKLELSKNIDERKTQIFYGLKSLFSNLKLLGSNTPDRLAITTSPNEKSFGNMYVYKNNPTLLFLSSKNALRHFSDSVRSLFIESESGKPMIRLQELPIVLKEMLRNYSVSDVNILNYVDNVINSLSLTSNRYDINFTYLIKTIKDEVRVGENFRLNKLFGFNWTRNNSRLNKEFKKIAEDCGFEVISLGGSAGTEYRNVTKENVNKLIALLEKLDGYSDQYIAEFSRLIEEETTKLINKLDELYDITAVDASINWFKGHYDFNHVAELIKIRSQIHKEIQNWYNNVYKIQFQDLLDTEISQYAGIYRFKEEYRKLKTVYYNKVIGKYLQMITHITNVINLIIMSREEFINFSNRLVITNVLNQQYKEYTQVKYAPSKDYAYGRSVTIDNHYSYANRVSYRNSKFIRNSRVA